MLNFYLINSENLISQGSAISNEIIQPLTSMDEEPISDLPAMDFKLENLDGDMVALSDYYGKPVMVNFLEVWCPPCRAELPLIQTSAELYRDEFVVLAINTGEEEKNVYNFIQDFMGNIIFLLDTSKKKVKEYDVRGLPTSVFINSEGSIMATNICELNDILLKAYLREIGVFEWSRRCL